MKLADFDYKLPEGFIAQYPLAKREQARLMVVDRQSQEIHHDIFSNVGKYLPPSSVLVVNDSKVIPARLLGRKQSTGGQAEIFLLNKLSDGYSYEALLRPLKRLRVGEKVFFGENGFYAEVLGKNIVRFNKKDISKELNRLGHMPLPPYIKRPDEKIDRDYYQTIYAKNDGSVAAPTAGLHFTASLLKDLKQNGHRIEKVTLHINYATLKLVQEDDIRNHKMHTETYAIAAKTFERLKEFRSQGQKIVAVGTTSCRVLESASATGKLKGGTDLFIYPGYEFQMTDCLLTNFHLPKSTLLMLVCAFGGHDFLMRAYREAIKEKYRFYSYGDAMLII